MLATGTDQFSSVADESFIGQSANNPNTNWASLLGGSNDDAGVRVQLFTPVNSLHILSQWVVLSLWKMADYKASRGLSNTAFLVSCTRIPFYKASSKYL